MNDLFYDDLDKVILEIKSSDWYKKLIELKSEIDFKYEKEINLFNKYKNEYNEALKYPDYYPGFESLKMNLSNAKAILYEKEEVKEYFKLNKLIQNELNDLTNAMSRAMSNKFLEKEW